MIVSLKTTISVWDSQWFTVFLLKVQLISSSLANFLFWSTSLQVQETYATFGEQLSCPGMLALKNLGLVRRMSRLQSLGYVYSAEDPYTWDWRMTPPCCCLNALMLFRGIIMVCELGIQMNQPYSWCLSKGCTSQRENCDFRPWFPFSWPTVLPCIKKLLEAFREGEVVIVEGVAPSFAGSDSTRKSEQHPPKRCCLYSYHARFLCGDPQFFFWYFP